MQVCLFYELTGEVFPASLSALRLFQTLSVALIQTIPRGVLCVPYRNIHHATVRFLRNIGELNPTLRRHKLDNNGSWGETKCTYWEKSRILLCYASLFVLRDDGRSVSCKSVSTSFVPDTIGGFNSNHTSRCLECSVPEYTPRNSEIQL
jgi:hypothetical protein